MRIKDIFINTGLVLISCLIPLIAMEIYLRVTDTTPFHANAMNSFHVADPHIGWKGRPDFRGIHKTSSFEALVEYGSDGYRKAQSNTTPLGEAKRIAFMGDSFAWGWGVSQGELFTDHLQDLLGKKYRLKNFGVNTFCTVQYAIQLEKEVLEWRPESVGMLFYSNDFRDNLNPRDNRRPYCEIRDGSAVLANYPVQNPIGSIGKSITIHSHALTTLRYYINTSKAMIRELAYKYRGAAKTKETPVANVHRVPVATSGIQYVNDDEALAFRTYLKRIGDTAKRNGIHFFVVYAPTGVNIAKEKSMRHNYLEVVKSACDDFGIDLIDLTPGFEQGLTGMSGEPYYYTIDNHWTPKGHELAAKIVAPYLLNGSGQAIVDATH